MPTNTTGRSRLRSKIAASLDWFFARVWVLVVLGLVASFVAFRH